MATISSIEWTEVTWNPVTGCTKISPGCKNCYADRMSKRLQAMGLEKYSEGFHVRLHERLLSEPLSWIKPRLVFVNSMSDLFHEDIPLDFILRVFDVMRNTKRHTFQVLTKRSKRLYDLSQEIDWPNNVWMGVSIENEEYVYRSIHLRETRSKVKFLSLEPLIGPLPSLILRDIDWVIVGGESGPGARPMDEEWVIEIRDKCINDGVPFFFKQWGGVNRKKRGRVLQGQMWGEMPLVFGT